MRIIGKLTFLFLAAAVITSPAFAQADPDPARPECIEDSHSVCFDETEFGIVYQHRDANGQFGNVGDYVYIETFGTAEDDFFRYQPDGSIFFHTSEIEASIVWCAGVQNVFNCLDFSTFPATPKADAWVGTGHLNLNARGEGGFIVAPSVVNARGTVTAPNGTEFNFDFNFVWAASGQDPILDDAVVSSCFECTVPQP